MVPHLLALVTAAASPLAVVDCETGDAVGTVAASSPLCATGTVESACATPTLSVVAAGDLALEDVTDNGPDLVTSTVTQQQVASPPLATGTFDLVVDIDCDGALSAADTRIASAVVVPVEAVAVSADASAFHAEWAPSTAALAALSVQWARTQSSPLLAEETAATWQHAGGNPALTLLWTSPDTLVVVPIPPAGVALLDQGEALEAALALAGDALSSSDPGRALSWDPATDVGYPFAGNASSQDARDRSKVASAWADAAVLLAGLHGTLVALEGTSDNTEAARLAHEGLARAAGLGSALADLQRITAQLRARANSVPANSALWDPDDLSALQERVATSGWTTAERELFELHALDPDEVAAELQLAPALDAPASYQSTLDALDDVLDSAAAALDALQAHLQAVADAHAPFAIQQDPTVTLTGPFFGREGQELALAGASDSPRAAPLELRWDLDHDGAFDDGDAEEARWVPPAAARSLARLQAEDDRGVVIDGFAVVEVETARAPSTWLELGPEALSVARVAEAPVSFLALAQAGTGQPLTYTFLVDGVEQSTVSSTLVDEPAFWDWLPTNDDVGLHYVEAVAVDPTGDRAPAHTHWSIEITPAAPSSTDGTSGGDGGSDPDDDTGSAPGGASATPGAPDDGGCGGGAAIGVAWLALLGLVRRRYGVPSSPSSPTTAATND